MSLETLIFIGGILHFGILIASALVPNVLNWKSSLQVLDPLSRHLVWTHGVFVVFVIVGFGMLSILFSGDLATGTPLARGMCSFIAFFWAARLFVQFFVFDASAYLNGLFLKVGYHGLTLTFGYFAVVYSVAAFWAMYAPNESRASTLDSSIVTSCARFSGLNSTTARFGFCSRYPKDEEEDISVSRWPCLSSGTRAWLGRFIWTSFLLVVVVR